LVAPQRSQLLRDGAESFQAEARRLRVFDFDFFFFGTAILETWKLGLGANLATRFVEGTRSS
jgi:hypothetical protein